MIGIDRPVERDGYSVGKWVLGDFSDEQLQALHTVAFPAAEEQLRLLITEPLAHKVDLTAILDNSPADARPVLEPLAAPPTEPPTDL